MVGVFFYGKGIKKTSVAKVFLIPGLGKFYVNGVNVRLYFNNFIDLIDIIYEPLHIIENFFFDVYVSVRGGGIFSQISAIKSALVYSLIDYNKCYKYLFNKFTLTTVDYRHVERKKIGLVKSRKKKQFSKR